MTTGSAQFLGLDYEPVKGDRIAFIDDGSVHAIAFVNRVSKGKWADIEVFSIGSKWTKRQPLPWRIKDARHATDADVHALAEKREARYGN